MTPYYDRDGVTIYHGEALDVLRYLPDHSIDAVITDPPYSSGGQFRGDRATRTTTAKYGTKGRIDALPDFEGDTRDQRGYLLWSSIWMAEVWRLLKPTGLVFVFTDWRQLPTTSDALQVAGIVWRGIVTWYKGPASRPVPNQFRQDTEFVVWGSRGPIERDYENGAYPAGVVEAPPPTNRVHMTQKPTGVIHHLLKLVPEEATVLDPFMGTGTTLHAVRDSGRESIGVELSEEWCNYAVDRLAQGVLAFD